MKTQEQSKLFYKKDILEIISELEFLYLWFSQDISVILIPIL